MQPPSAAGIPGIYLPPVQPLPGSNQYGGFPINPFPGQGPAAPQLARNAVGPAPTNPKINLGYTNPTFSSVNPVESRPAESRRQVIDRPGGLDFPITPPPQPATPNIPINPAGGPPPPNPLVDTPIISRPNPMGFTPNTGQIGLDPNLVAQTTGRTFGGAGPIVGVVGDDFHGGGIASDIRNKDNIQPLEPVFAHGINRDARPNANVKQPLPVADKQRLLAGGPGAMLGAAIGRGLQGQQPGQPASFEGQNPMMGLGAQAQPDHMPAPPFGQDPRLAQQTVNIPFGQMSPNDMRDQDTAYFNQPYDPSQPYPKSDERTKQNIKGYVSSPREAKQDIRAVDTALAPSDYQDQWRGVSMQDSAAPQQQFPQFSMSAPPIVPGRDPAVDLRPAQGYSYDYKDPNAPGAKPGRQFGPMAQDLEKTPAGRSVVEEDPRTGMKAVDTSRLTMVNTAAISEQQRKLDELMALLDSANLRATQDTGPRKGRY